MENLVDIIIIGAGPAGLSAAVNALTRGKTVRIFSNRENYLTTSSWAAASAAALPIPG